MIRLNFKEFLKDSSGGTAVAMGVCLVTLAIVLGAGLDTTRLVSAKQKTVDALDAATLYAVNQSEEGDFNFRAQTYFADQLSDSPFSIDASNFEMLDGARLAQRQLIFHSFLELFWAAIIETLRLNLSLLCRNLQAHLVLWP